MRVAEGRESVALGDVDTLTGMAHHLGITARALNRLRARRSDFPLPVADAGGRVYFDVNEVSSWYYDSVGG